MYVYFVSGPSGALSNLKTHTERVIALLKYDLMDKYDSSTLACMLTRSLAH